MRIYVKEETTQIEHMKEREISKRKERELRVESSPKAWPHRLEPRSMWGGRTVERGKRDESVLSDKESEK